MHAAAVSDAASAPSAATDVFVYGTLTHPQILRRVLGLGPNAALHVQAYPALLASYAAHHVRGEDYPALRSVPWQKQTRQTFARGLLLRGLQPEHVRLLDAFEGDQ